MNGIKQTLSAPYHPQTNGLAENAVKFVKNKLKRVLHDKKDVNIALSRILFDYRNTVHATTNESPAKLMFNRPLRSRLDLIRPQLSQTVEQKQYKQISNARGSKLRHLFPNQSVLLRDYRNNRNKWIKGIVLKQLNPVTYFVQLPSGMIWKRHIDQLIALNTPDTEVGYSNEPPVILDKLPTVLEQNVDRDIAQTQPSDKRRTQGSPHNTPVHKDRQSVTIALPESPSTSAQTHAPTQEVEVPRRYPSRVRKPTCRLTF